MVFLHKSVSANKTDHSSGYNTNHIFSLIAALCAPIYLIYLPSVKGPGASEKSIVRELLNMDWAGFILSTGAVVSFVMVLTFAGSLWAWNSRQTIATFVVFGVLLILTTVQQHFLIFTTRETRMVPPSYILQNRSQVLLNIETAATITNVFVPLYYIPLYFQFVHGDTAIMAAVRLLPFVLILVCTNMVSGLLLPKIGY